MRRFALLVIWATLPFGLSAGRLTLRDGTVIFGQFISGTSSKSLLSRMITAFAGISISIRSIRSILMTSIRRPARTSAAATLI